MSYTITLQGHSDNRTKVQEIFEDTVRSLKAIPESSGPYGQYVDNDRTIGVDQVDLDKPNKSKVKETKNPNDK